MFPLYAIGHAGVSPIVSQTALTILLMVLGISIIAFAFGRAKNPENLRLHRVIMSAAILILLVPVFLVMLPATFTFYTDPDIQLFSPLSIITAIHGVVGFPVVLLGLVFVANDLPKNLRAWMQRTSILMVASVGIGILLYLVMLDVITFGAAM